MCWCRKTALKLHHNWEQVFNETLTYYQASFVHWWLSKWKTCWGKSHNKQKINCVLTVIEGFEVEDLRWQETSNSQPLLKHTRNTWISVNLNDCIWGHFFCVVSFTFNLPVVPFYVILTCVYSGYVRWLGKYCFKYLTLIWLGSSHSREKKLHYILI